MKDSVKEALNSLREQGIHIPRKFLSRATREQPPMRHADLHKFRAYCDQAWKQKNRASWSAGEGRSGRKFT